MKLDTGMVCGVLLVAMVGLSGAISLGAGLDNWDVSQPVGPAEPVPEFAVELADGGRLGTSDLAGGVTLVTFWATWCSACGMQMPTYAALEDQFAGTDLRMIGVNRDSGSPAHRREIIAQYMQSKDIEFEQALDDGKMASAFRVQVIPHLVLVDREGQIRHVHVGRTREKVLAREIEALLDE